MFRDCLPVFPFASFAPRRLTAVLWLGLCLPAGIVLAEMPAVAPSDAASRQQEEVQRQFELNQQQRMEEASKQQLKTPDIQVDPKKLTGQLPQPVRVSPASSPVATPDKDAPCFVIQSVVLTGDFAPDFHTAVRPLEKGKNRITGQQCLGVQGINAAASYVQDRLIARGYVTTRVLVPSQNLASGTLVLQLVPGRLGEVLRSGPANRATLLNAVPVKSGELLNIRDIEQGLENFKRLTSVEADLKLAPSSRLTRPGYTDILVNWQQQKPWRVSASVDNAGSRYTGVYQGNVTLALDNALRANDLFYVGLSHDLRGGLPGRRGSHGYNASYTIPLGYWLVTTGFSDNTYSQNVAGLNQDYLYSGTSRNITGKLTRLMYRDSRRKTALIVGGNYRASHNFINDVEVQVQQRRTTGVEAGINHREFVGRGTLDATFTFHHGTGAFNALPAPEEAFGEGSSREGFSRALVYFNQPFELRRRPFSWNSEWRAQFSTSQLIPQDRFSIGSRYTVRGFDGEQMLTGDRGYILRNEVSTPVAGDKAGAYAGIDYGHVGGQSTVSPYPQPGNHLVGSVAGFKGKLPHGFSYDTFIGIPVWKPDYFQTKKGVFGFAVYWSY